MIKGKDEEQKRKVCLVENLCKKVATEKRVVGQDRVSAGLRTGILAEEDVGKIHRTIQRYEVRRRKRWLKTEW